MADSKNFHPEIESVEEFLQRFKLQNFDLLDKAKDNPNRCASYLANALPIEVLTDVQRRLQPTQLIDVTYPQLERQLIASYSVKKSIVGAAVAFVSRKQLTEESIESFAKVLNQLAAQCGYSDRCRDRLLRDVFLSGLRSSSLLRHLIPDCDGKTFQECVEKAKTIEQVALDVEDIHPGNSETNSPMFKVERTHQDNEKATPSASYKCIRCGRQGQHFARVCFAQSNQWLPIRH